MFFCVYNFSFELNEKLYSSFIAVQGPSANRASATFFVSRALHLLTYVTWIIETSRAMYVLNQPVQHRRELFTPLPRARTEIKGTLANNIRARCDRISDKEFGWSVFLTSVWILPTFLFNTWKAFRLSSRLCYVTETLPSDLRPRSSTLAEPPETIENEPDEFENTWMLCRVAVDLNRRSWVRFPPRSKE